MPFELYLRADDDQHRSQQYSNSYGDYTDGPRYGVDGHSFSNGIQLQIPQFMYNGPPILAPGGGAEVLPAGLLDSPGSFASSWFANNGFVAPFHHSSHSRNHHPSVEETSRSSTAQSSSSNCYDSYNVPHSIPYTHVDYSSHLSPPPAAPPPPHIGAPPSFSAADILNFNSNTSDHPAPSPPGLPIYSSSGFDLLSILSRVVSRPHPNIILGPVDSSCSFTVADVRRHDCPIIYASPSFYQLTGYQEHEVLGRNCRFLQSPDGNVQKGEERRFVPSDAVALLKKALAADKECRTTIVNYRKGGQPFINLVTVIPIRGGVSNHPEEADEVVYHVGFQVDLTEQPNVVLQKFRDGSHIGNYSMTANGLVPTPLGPPARGRLPLPSSVLSKDLRSLITDAKFTSSIPLSTSVNIPPSSITPDKPDTHDGNQLLHMLLLEKSPDFIVVLSLKGAFLYVAPSVRLVLGYEPEELVGKSISDYCHPADLVPLMRELKESSITPSTTSTDTASPSATSSHSHPSSLPKTVDLLFRARAKSTAYAWIECRGRLHVEPGKGRKAIILSGRSKWMPSLSWRAIARAGGLGDTQEVWGMVSADGTVLVTSATVRDILGWSVSEIIGKTLRAMVVGAEQARVEAAIQRASGEGAQGRRQGQGHGTEDEPTAIICTMLRKDCSTVPVRLVVYRPPTPAPAQAPTSTPTTPAHPLVIQITLLGTSSSSTLMHPEVKDVFEELDTSRGSSWQYELQQLRFANQRLCEEVDALEVCAPGYQQQQPHQQQQQYQHQQQRQQQQPQRRHRHPQQQQTVVHSPDDVDWTSLIGGHTISSLSSSLAPMNSGSASSSLKRTWHSGDGPT